MIFFKELLLTWLTICTVFSISTGTVSLYHKTDLNATYELSSSVTISSLIISLTNMQWFQEENFCQISEVKTDKATIKCTPNIKKISYLIFQTSISMNVGIYTHYFFEGNMEKQEKVNLTSLIASQASINRNYFTDQFTHSRNQKNNNTIKIALCGVALTNEKNYEIDIGYEGDGIILFKRTLNIKWIKISFLSLNNGFLYRISQSSFALSEQKFSFPTYQTQINSKMIFIEDIKVSKKKLNQNIQFNLDGDETTSSIHFSNNIEVSGQVLEFKAISCSEGYYYSFDTYNCHSTCNNNYQQSYKIGNQKFCLQKNNTNFTSYLNRSINNNFSQLNLNNIISLEKFTPFGCSQPVLGILSSVTCGKCKDQYYKYTDNCVCKYGYYMSDSSCFECGENCGLKIKTKVAVVQQSLKYDTIEIEIRLPTYVEFKGVPSSSYLHSVIINGKKFTAKMIINQKQRIISMKIPNVVSDNTYKVSLKLNNQSKEQPFFLIESFSETFLFSPQSQATSQKQISTKQIAESFEQIFTNTETTLPTIYAVAFMVGEKINILSIFQTSALLYLVTFMKLEYDFKDVKQIIGKIFSFHPSPFYEIIGSGIQVPKLSKEEIKNQNIYEYTEGKMYLTLGFNNLIIIISEILFISGIFALILKCLGSSSSSGNKIKNLDQQSNTNQKRLQTKFDLKRSVVNKNGEITWLQNPLIRSSCSFRQKAIFHLSKLSIKKTITINSMIMSQLLSNSLFILLQFQYAITDKFMIIQLFYAFCMGFIVLCYPFLMLKADPLNLFKSIKIVYKRVGTYKFSQLWMFFYIVYMENILFAISVLIFEQGIYQAGSIMLIHVFKVIIMRKYIKNLELIKNLFIIGFFGTIVFTQFGLFSQDEMAKEAIIIMALLIIVCELLKILKGIIVIVLEFFKDIPQPQSVQQKDEVKNQSKEKKQRKPKLEYALVEQIKQETVTDKRNKRKENSQSLPKSQKVENKFQRRRRILGEKNQ